MKRRWKSLFGLTVMSAMLPVGISGSYALLTGHAQTQNQFVSAGSVSVTLNQSVTGCDNRSRHKLNTGGHRNHFECDINGHYCQTNSCCVTYTITNIGSVAEEVRLDTLVDSVSGENVQIRYPSNGYIGHGVCGNKGARFYTKWFLLQSGQKINVQYKVFAPSSLPWSNKSKDKAYPSLTFVTRAFAEQHENNGCASEAQLQSKTCSHSQPHDKESGRALNMEARA